MLFENRTNRKKGDGGDLYSPSGYGTSPESFDGGYGNAHSMSADEWNAAKERTSARLASLENPVDTGASWERFKNSFGNTMVPKDTPERRRRMYALSPQALDSVVSDYYKNELKGAFDRNREQSAKRTNEEYMRYVSVPGANPEDAFRASQSVDSPSRVIDRTINGIDDEKLLKKVAPLAAYGGYDAKEYVDKLVKPSLRDRMAADYVEEYTPKSSGEYVMRSALDNSLLGKAGTLASGALSREKRMLAAQGLANYDSSRLENFAAGTGGLLLDMPVFSGLGSAASALVGKATAKATEKLAARVMSRNADKLISEKFADAVARRAITDNLGAQILQSSSVQGLTLGSYDIANSVVGDILYNGSVDAGKAAGSFMRGLATGAAVGAVGTPLKLRGKGLTGGKKLLSSAGVLSAESAVFTLGTEVDKLAHGVDIAPVDLLYDFGESAATLLTMRMANWIPKGAFDKLGRDGRLKNGLEFTESEMEEMQGAIRNPEEFVRALEKELRMPRVGSADAQIVKSGYTALMADDALSASAKSKLMYLVENKITSTPPLVFDYDVRRNARGKWKVSLLDARGGVVEHKSFEDSENAKSFLMLQRANIRRNRIAHYEKELSSGIETQNFLQEAAVYAKENGVGVDRIADAMYKAARREGLNVGEQEMLDDIISRSKHSEALTNKALYDARRSIEKEFKLDSGELLHCIDKGFLSCSATENKALDAYESRVRDIVEKSKGRDGVLFGQEADSRFAVNNETIKRQELDDYYEMISKRYAGQGENKSTPGSDADKLVKIPEMEPGMVWSPVSRNKSTGTIRQFEKRGKDIARKFGYDVEFILDEHDIEMPETLDRDAVMNYNNRLSAKGWYNNGKIHINLPNMDSVEDLERTIVHEVVGHQGLRKVFGNYLSNFLEDVYWHSDGSVRKGIKKIERTYKGIDKLSAVEEYLATILEKSFPDANESNLLTRFKDFARGLLVRGGIYTGKNRRMSESDVESLMKAHYRHTLRGKERSAHRKELFGRYPSANFNEEGYYDRDAYMRDKSEIAKDPSYMRFTPMDLKGAKYAADYPYFPEDVQEMIRRSSGLDDAALRRQRDAAFRYSEFEDDDVKMLDYPEAKGYRLEDALKSERDGYSPEYIKEETGWERDDDGRWRRGIPESGKVVDDIVDTVLERKDPELSRMYSKLKDYPFEYWGEKDKKQLSRILSKGGLYNENYVLSDLIKDTHFFLSYPDLSNMPVKIVADAPSLISYDKMNKRVLVDGELFVTPDVERHVSEMLPAVIEDYENFNKYVDSRIRGLEFQHLRKYKIAMKVIRHLKSQNGKEEYDDKGEFLERAFMKDYGMRPDDFAKLFPKFDDYLYMKLNPKDYDFIGAAGVDEMRKRYGYSDSDKNMPKEDEPSIEFFERYPYLKDLEVFDRIISGPVDVIDKAVEKEEAYNAYEANKAAVEQMLKDDRVLDEAAKEINYEVLKREIMSHFGKDSHFSRYLLEKIREDKPERDPYGYERHRDRVKKKKEWAKRMNRDYEVDDDYFVPDDELN